MQQPEMAFLFAFVVYVILLANGIIAQQCRFSIKSDGTKKVPIFLEADASTIFIPGKDGEVTIRRGDRIYLACPGVTNQVTGYRKTMVTAVCSTGNSFHIEGNTLPESYTNIECRQHPEPYQMDTIGCPGTNGNGQLYIEMGFDFNGNRRPQMHICFDSVNKKTFWARMEQSSVPFRDTISNQNFKDKYFDNMRPDNLYRNQHLCLPLQYVSRNGIQKGHLIARADFFDAARQRLTYYYVNTSPQWRSFNEGNWKNMEIVVRKENERRGSSFYVYTGTHDTLKVDNKIVVLDNDRHCNARKMPVPLFLWKVVIESTSGNGVAFIGVNNPYQSYRELCTDVCFQITWLRNFENLRKDQHKGYIYCCKINDLRRIPNIVVPNFSEWTGGLLN